MTNELALEQLKALVKVPGALKIITVRHKCQQPDLTDAEGFDPKKCFAYVEEIGSTERYGKNPLADPCHYVCQDVVRLEDLHDRGQFKAWTEEGSWCKGYPVDLLSRLTEAGRAGVS